MTEVRKPGRGCNSAAIAVFEKYFQWHGRLVARHPYVVLLTCVIFSAICGIGVIRYREEKNPYRLWIPQDSDFVANTEWLWDNFPPDYRFNSIIISADNVLRPSVIRQILLIHDRLHNTSTGRKTWDEYCYQIPVVDLRPQDDDEKEDLAPLDFGEPEGSDYSELYNFDYGYTDYATPNTTRKRRALLSDADPSVDLYPDSYCDFVGDVTTYTCFENSLLEIWATDLYGEATRQSVQSLSEKDILDKINTANFSEPFYRDLDVSKYLGGIQRNSSGHIVGARATFIQFFGRVNSSAISEADRQGSAKGQPVDVGTLAYERALMDSLDDALITDPPGMKVVVNIARSFNDLASESISGDAFIFGAGFGIVFIYAQLMLGRFNFVEQKPLLSAVGIGSVGLTILVSYGLCSAMGLLYSPMHSIIPFLLLGIGIDDMFVIIACLDNLDNRAAMPIEEQIGKAMKHAGVAITVTSLTDFVVFGIGATTVLPALQSFCLYCAVGILFVYIFQSTFFVAALTLDTRRIAQKRNGFFFCYQHKNWEPNKVSQMNLGKKAFEKFGTGLMHPVSKTLVLLVTTALLGIGVWNTLELRQEFNPVWFIPQKSSLAHWYKANEEFFPRNGERVTVNIADIDYSKELPKISRLLNLLANETDVVGSVDAWFIDFKEYIESNDLVKDEIFHAFGKNLTEFHQTLTQFLFSPSGAKYRPNFHFMNDIICGEESPPVLLSTLAFTHRQFSGPSEHIPAMRRVKEIIRSVNFSSRAFALADEYASWETDEIIAVETYRNLGLSLVSVLIATLLLIVNINASFVVFASVLLTMVNVSGFMHVWGLTIDVISCVNLVIAIGLCVDYSVHIAHNFVIEKGTKSERAIKALRDIGPAVLNGGFTTFLAFVLTAGSESHVFITFFKIFFLVVFFGLFHGLVFLPVALSLIGPAELVEKIEEESKMENKEGEDNNGYAS